MPPFNSVMRRYAPPTCTLEIMAKRSPLSEWTGKPVLKELKFRLSFEPSQESVEKTVVIRGDRDQLEELYEAIAAYLQNFLYPPGNGSVSPLLGLEPELSLGKAEETPVAPEGKIVSLETILPPMNANAIYLQPRGLLSHNLFLGSLATEESGAVICLGTLQLFDLATALDAYTVEIMALPNLRGATTSWWRGPGLRVAAIALVAVGLSATVVRLIYQNPPALQISTAPETTPEITVPSETAAPRAETLESASEPVEEKRLEESEERGPNTAKEEEAIASLPNGQGRESAGGTSAPEPEQPTTREKITTERPPSPPAAIPQPPAPEAARVPQTVEIYPPAPEPARVPQIVEIYPPAPEPSRYPESAEIPPPKPQESNTPKPEQILTGPSSAPVPAPAVPAPPAASAPAKGPVASDSPEETLGQRNTDSDEMAEAPPIPETAVAEGSSSEAESLGPDEDGAGRRQGSGNNSGGNSGDNSEDSAIARGDSAEVASGAPALRPSDRNSSGDVEGDISAGENAPAPAAENADSFFGDPPQVAQAREYFQERWQPPDGFSQTLEYRLILNPEGAVKEIVPLGNASETNLQISGIPSPGKSFVSPLQERQTLTIRVVLKPDGTVQAFSETGN